MLISRRFAGGFSDYLFWVHRLIGDRMRFGHTQDPVNLGVKFDPHWLVLNRSPRDNISVKIVEERAPGRFVRGGGQECGIGNWTSGSTAILD